MTRQRKQRSSFPLAGLLLGAVLAVGAIGMVIGSLDRGQETDITAGGIAYLESLEQQDPNAVIQVLRQRRLAELEAQREELLRQIKGGELSPFTMFDDAVILGDSRAVGFSYYGFVDESRMITGTGDTILNLPSKIDTLAAMNPKYIYLCYGLNDIKIGYWPSLDSHIQQYLEYVDRIRQALPDSVVIISSVLPYVEPTSGQSDSSDDPDLKRLAKIPNWNSAMAQACAEAGIIFVDNSQISADHRNLWEPDGIHMQEPFYPYWAKNLVIAALEEGEVTIEDDIA